MVTAASDVYSLGVVGYECVAGCARSTATSQVAIALAQINRPPPPLPADVPRQVRALIERALAKDPAPGSPTAAPSPRRSGRSPPAVPCRRRPR